MSRDRELVDLVRQVFGNKLAPSLEEAEGEWYIFEKQGHQSIIGRNVVEWSDGVTAETWFKVRGWTVTPVMVHKVVAIR